MSAEPLKTLRFGGEETRRGGGERKREEKERGKE